MSLQHPLDKLILCEEGKKILLSLPIRKIYPNNDYVQCLIGSEVFSIHKLLMGENPGRLDIDHINMDKHDNRLENLRFVSRSVNKLNQNKRAGKHTAKFKGVHFCKRDNRFVSRITIETKRKCLGYFKDEIAAAKAYDKYCEENNIAVATNKSLGLYDKSTEQSTTS